MLETILRTINNFFVVGIYEGTCVVENGGISLPFLVPGQYFRVFGSVLNDGVYFRVFGSVLNDGVYQYPTTALQDEAFDGVIWALAIPQALIRLSYDIDEWINQNREAVYSPYKSESCGGYSYTKADGRGGDDGTAATWEDVFAVQLAPYRKPREVSYIGIPRRPLS